MSIYNSTDGIARSYNNPTIKYDKVMVTPAQNNAIRKMASRNGMEFSDLTKSVAPMFGCNNAVCVPLGYIYIAVEEDGYTHS